MALWMVRAGKYGEHEDKFLEEGRVYLTWNRLSRDLGKLSDRQALQATLREVYPGFSEGKINNHAGQHWAFAQRMKPGDWIAMPSKKKPAIHIAEITGPYEFNASAEDPYYHSRRVKWIKTDVPRSNFDQDMLYSLGAFMTVCQIKRNNAEERIRAMVSGTGVPLTDIEEDDGDGPEAVDLEQLARDQIAKLIMAKFKGHGLPRLVAAILDAEGYTTHVSAEGPDKGVDILAATGSLGFGAPKICVQVKSADSPVDRPTLDQLIGVIRNFRADQGLLVSWGGFRSSVEKERASQFFQVRLWDQDALIENLLEQYDRLPAEIRAELPLKQVWTVAAQNEDADTE